MDGFQGSECDIIILSCVRSHSMNNRRGKKIHMFSSPDIHACYLTENTEIPTSPIGGQRRGAVGFLSDYRRVNVALTRAKQSLWVVGNSDVLKASDLWRKLLDHMHSNRVLNHARDFDDWLARWKRNPQSLQPPDVSSRG